MERKLSLKIILGISIAGILFSGYLSYTEVFKNTCMMGSCTNIGQIPACVYGFLMYIIIGIISITGIKSKK